MIAFSWITSKQLYLISMGEYERHTSSERNETGRQEQGWPGISRRAEWRVKENTVCSSGSSLADGDGGGRRTWSETKTGSPHFARRQSSLPFSVPSGRDRVRVGVFLPVFWNAGMSLTHLPPLNSIRCFPATSLALTLLQPCSRKSPSSFRGYYHSPP